MTTDTTTDADTAEPEETEPVTDEAEADDRADPDGERRWPRIVAYAALPALTLLLAIGAGYLKWQDDSARLARTAADQSVAVATDSAIAMLSYRPDTVDTDLPAAADGLTGPFQDEYRQLIEDVVAPGAKQQQISSVATVPAAASVTASATHAVVLLSVNQALTIGSGSPTNTASSVRVTLDKVGDRWLVSQFEPV